MDARESQEETVSFSELDEETDSVVETQSVKDSIIEENEEEEEEVPPSAPNFRLGRLADKDERLKTASNDANRQQAVLQKTSSHKTETETRNLMPPDTAKILAAVETKHHTEPRVPKGIVGFASLPDQVR